MDLSKKQANLGESGSISHGTLLPEDLIPAFAMELRALCTEHREHIRLVDEANHLAQRNGFDNEHVDELIIELIDALNEHAPEGHYFGAHEGDGSDFGFWPIEDDDEIVDRIDRGDY